MRAPTLPRLLERETPLAVLAAALADAAAGRGRLVFVTGEAGVGKTALVRSFCESVEPGTRILEGSCDALATARPLGPIADIALEAGGPLAVVVAADCTPSGVVTILLAELRDRPTVLVLEDVHWADEATLDVLRLLGRRAQRTRALVIATYRDDELDAAHPLRLVVGDLATTEPIRVPVPPLTVAAVRTLAGPTGLDPERLHARTGGNAFFVTEAVAASDDDVPATIRDAVLARAVRLDPEARRLLDVVSLVPAAAELWLLEAVAPVELETLPACVSSGMLREQRNAVAFRHELARLAVRDAVAANRRRSIHRAILRALSQPPAGRPDEARLAHHAEEAGETAVVLGHATRAAERAAAVGAHREAAAHYARALRHSDDLDTSDRAALLAAFADEALPTARHEEAIAARREAAALYRSLGAYEAEGAQLWRATTPLISLGRNVEAEEASIAAIDVLERLEPTLERAKAYCAQSYMRMLGRDNQDGVAWGLRAAELAERFGDPDTTSFALNMIGTSRVMAGDISRGVAELRRGLAVAREHGLEVRIAQALTMLGSGLGEMYELELAEPYLREHIAFADEHDISPSYTQSWLALVHVYRGRWDEGTALAHPLTRHPVTISRISGLIALGRVRARRGDPGGIEVLDEAIALAREGGHLQRLGHVHAARAEAAWLAGDRDGALGHALAAYPLAVDKRHLWFAGELAYWQWKAGSLGDAAPAWIAEPYRLQIEGAPRKAAEAWQRRGCPYESARALAESVETDGLRDALATFERLGAAPAARSVRASLRSLGVTVPRGPRPATRANAAALTGRELEVLSLVAEGMRNGDIAERLFLSPRTVDHHVSAILRKLEAKSRGEAVAEASRLRLLRPE